MATKSGWGRDKGSNTSWGSMRTNCTNENRRNDSACGPNYANTKYDPNRKLGAGDSVSKRRGSAIKGFSPFKDVKGS